MPERSVLDDVREAREAAAEVARLERELALACARLNAANARLLARAVRPSVVRRAPLRLQVSA